MELVNMNRRKYDVLWKNYLNTTLHSNWITVLC